MKAMKRNKRKTVIASGCNVKITEEGVIAKGTLTEEGRDELLKLQRNWMPQMEKKGELKDESEEH